ncbi:MAG: N-acetyltransferase [Planctomycetota bacterium]|nr:N-acetyltransferase [Planctomycetota bacterium]
MAKKNEHAARVRRARVTDVPEMHDIINEYALEGLMLPKSKGELYEGIRDFYVAEGGGRILGCAALHVMWEDLAEIRSVAVRREYRHTGIGSRLVRACLREAAALGLPRVFVLTLAPDYFARFGFSVVDKDSLPRKIWADCLRCPRFANCNETAMIADVAAILHGGAAAGREGGRTEAREAVASDRG